MSKRDAELLALRAWVGQLRNAIQKAEGLEIKSHQLFDEAFGNIVYGNPSDKSRQKCIENTGIATELHGEAMSLLRTALLLDAGDALDLCLSLSELNAEEGKPDGK